MLKVEYKYEDGILFLDNFIIYPFCHTSFADKTRVLQFFEIVAESSFIDRNKSAADLIKIYESLFFDYLINLRSSW